MVLATSCKPGNPSNNLSPSNSTSGTTGNGATNQPQEVPSHPPTLRLTNLQYDNTVRDLLGVGGHPSDAFAEDEIQAGFTSNATNPIQELQLTQYEQAAHSLSAQATSTSLNMLAPCPSGASEASCVVQFITSFGKRAYRRPLVADEISRYESLYTEARTTGNYSSGIALLIEAMLQSPYFLYRVELGAANATPEEDGSIPLSSYEVATRLSYLIWNTTPDDTLLAAADENRLSQPEDVATMAKAMLAHVRSRDGMAAFHEQWLQLNGLETSEKLNPAFTPAVKAAMGDEFVDVVDDILRQGDGRLATMLTANYSIIEPPLYPWYGLTAPANPTQTPTRITPTTGQPRAGILTLPAVMTTHAHFDQTSIVFRGLMVREQFLCTPMPSPPANVSTELPPVDPHVSAVMQLQQHVSDPSCASCHNLMDPLGAPFEMFDSIGQMRTMDGNQPIDATGALNGTATQDGPVTSPLDLARRLVAADEVRTCLAKQWFRYAFGRAEANDDQPTIDIVLKAFGANDYRIPDLVMALVTSREFRYRQPVRLQ